VRGGALAELRLALSPVAASGKCSFFNDQISLGLAHNTHHNANFELYPKCTDIVKSSRFVIASPATATEAD
jgi:hypothetical protein